MKNNYRILITNNEKERHSKPNRNLFNFQYNNSYNNKTNDFFYKLIIINFLIIILISRIAKIKKITELEQQEINEENQPINEIHQKASDFWNCTFLKNEMHYYRLYEKFKFPQITLILMDYKNHKEELFQIINHIKNITSQNFVNIEILLCIQKMKKSDYNIIRNKLIELIDNNVVQIYNEDGNMKNTYTNLINLIKGEYTIFINNLSLLNNIQIEKFYNYTKNKIDYYFNISISKEENIYLLKTKPMKDFIDNKFEFSSFEMILNKYISIPLPQFSYISIALCPDNRFTKLAYVTMTSILSNKNYNTYISFYIIIPSEFEKDNIKLINSLYEEYYYFNITFIKMDKRYEKAYTDWRITQHAYYRFSLGELLPNLNKIIYFDTDIIVYKDLSNFYNLNFNGKMILGQPTYGNKKKGKKSYHSVNTGVLLLNLIEMRQKKMEEKVINIIKKGKKYKYHDQTLLNYNFKKYLGIFPPEYHSRPWSNYKEMSIFISRVGNPFDKDYYYFSNKYPTIRHFLGDYKPRNPRVNHIEDWWFYARKSKYYNKTARTFDTAFSI